MEQAKIANINRIGVALLAVSFVVLWLSQSFALTLFAFFFLYFFTRAFSVWQLIREGMPFWKALLESMKKISIDYDKNKKTPDEVSAQFRTVFQESLKKSENPPQSE